MTPTDDMASDPATLYWLRAAARGQVTAVGAAALFGYLRGLDRARAEAPLVQRLLVLGAVFHTRLVAASNNSRIQRAYSTLIVESSLCINRLERWYPDAASLFDEHSDIVNALESRDEAAFLSALRVHYLSSYSETPD